MAIASTCGNCHKTLRFADEHAGKRLKCPGCGTVLQLPVVSGPASPAKKPPVAATAPAVAAAPAIAAKPAPAANRPRAKSMTSWSPSAPPGRWRAPKIRP